MARAASKPASSEVGAHTRIAVYHGSDPFLQGERVRQLREALQAAHGPDGVDVFGFDAQSAQIADVLDECRSFDLMQRQKLVVVENADKLVAGDNRPLMERYAAAPAEHSTLALKAGKWNRGNLDKLIEKVGVIIKCEPPTAADAAKWAYFRAQKRHRAELDRDAAVALVERVGADLGRIDTEIAKLASAASGDDATPRITLALVHELVGRTREDEVWSIQSAIATGDASVALGAVRDAIRIARHPETLVAFACVDLVKKLHSLACLMEQGVPAMPATKRAGFWKDGDAFVPLARRAGPERLAALLSAVVEVDRRSKTGLTDPEIGCEVMAVRIASSGARAGA
ncbi:MAG: DNA polymerase III subunit delta [Phycisphaeraceae bacterium]|nr:DNA polymerase III subunit delta [Phycisphaeraceae bacterium]